ncbi:MAG: hypothetical protein OXD29_13520 [Roseovarius sp.]|nr:hypothetical protein [Roseovarius sp.]
MPTPYPTSGAGFKQELFPALTEIPVPLSACRQKLVAMLELATRDLLDPVPFELVYDLKQAIPFLSEA